MLIFTAIIAFLVIFSLLILVHEWGHFTAARKFGVKVEEFGFGLPPLAKKLFRDKKKTEYTLNWLPLGGFVRMKGEDSHNPKILKDKDSFAAKPVWQRIVIVCAGVVMNFITGFILLTLVFSSGNTYLTPAEKIDELLAQNPNAELIDKKPLGLFVENVPEDGIAAQTELQKFDFISAINKQSFTSVDEFSALMKENSGQETTLTIIRRSLEFDITIIPDIEGKIGIMIAGPFNAVKLRYPFLESVGKAGKETVYLTKLITTSIGGLFGSLLHGHFPDEIGGPVAIAKETFYRANNLTALLNFAAILSITLAIFNILPIPALDGGRLLFLIYEGIIRRRPNPQLEAKIHVTGYILLLGLIALISWHDIFG